MINSMVQHVPELLLCFVPLRSAAKQYEASDRQRLDSNECLGSAEADVLQKHLVLAQKHVEEMGESRDQRTIATRSSSMAKCKLSRARATDASTNVDRKSAGECATDKP